MLFLHEMDNINIKERNADQKIISEDALARLAARMLERSRPGSHDQPLFKPNWENHILFPNKPLPAFHFQASISFYEQCSMNEDECRPSRRRTKRAVLATRHTQSLGSQRRVQSSNNRSASRHALPRPSRGNFQNNTLLDASSLHYPECARAFWTE